MHMYVCIGICDHLLVFNVNNLFTSGFACHTSIFKRTEKKRSLHGNKQPSWVAWVGVAMKL